MNTFLKAYKNRVNTRMVSPLTKYSSAYYRSSTAYYHLVPYGPGLCINRNRLLSKYKHLLPVTAVAAEVDHYVFHKKPHHMMVLMSPNYYCTERYFHLGQILYESPSSKVEVTVQNMKDKQKEKVEEIIKEAAAGAKPDKNIEATADKQVAEKKPLKTRIWEELVHYYHGFRLLFIDIKICNKLLWRVLNGKTLSRRESKLLVRTTSDLFRLIPFSVFIVVPFLELALPLFIKLFPGMLPSTFQTSKEREDKLKRALQVHLEVAKFLQKTLDEMTVQHEEHKSEEAKQFAEFFKKIKDPNEYVANEEIIKFAKRFEDEITLDSLSREQLAALCRILELNTVGTSNLLRFQLRLKLRSLATDDRVISREGVNSLDLWELQQACKARGMRAYGLTKERMQTQLQEWIDLSLNEKVPPTLLLLSRAVSISDDTRTTEKLKETIRVLPESLAKQTTAAIGEREGKIDNKVKLESIQEEVRKIQEEREEERQEAKAKAKLEAKAQKEELVDKAKVIEDVGTELVDSAKVITTDVPASEKERPIEQTLFGETETAKEVEAKAKDAEEKSISSKDVELLSEALKTLSTDKKMVVEKETIKDLKTELEEYKEDVEELHEVSEVVKEPVKESIAAKLLFKKVNKMIGQLDQVVSELEKKQKDQTKDLKSIEPKKPIAGQEDIVQIDDLVQIIKKLQQTSDESRLKQIENVLSKLDADKDGAISVDEVLKVVEAIGRENVKLNEKQLEELIALLGREQNIEAEEKIEKAIAKSIKEAEKVAAEKTQANLSSGSGSKQQQQPQQSQQQHPQQQQSQQQLQQQQQSQQQQQQQQQQQKPQQPEQQPHNKTTPPTESLKDSAKIIHDTALNLDETDKKNLFKADPEILTPPPTTLPPTVNATNQVNVKDKMI